jgi:hypothetical protein
MLILQIDEPTLDAKIKQALKEVLMELGIEKLKNEPTERKTVSKRWIKENLKISYQTIDARMKDGSLKYRRLGKRIFFYMDEIEQAIAVKPIKRQGIKISK